MPPEEFTAARDAAAKVDRSLKALRKPSMSAWVVNSLVRRDPGLLAQLTDLGAALAQAQEHGQAGQLRELGEQRRALVAAVTDHALGLVGRELSAAVRAEVEATLEAALADPASAEAVRSGQLVRPLSYAGFGGVDLAGAVAPLQPATATAPKPKKPATTPAKEAAALEAAALEALQAAGALDDAVGRGEAATRVATAATAAVETAVAQEQTAAEAVRQAREALAAAEVEQQQAHRRRGVLEKEQQTAARRATAAAQAVAAAQDVSDTARKALDQLRRGT